MMTTQTKMNPPFLLTTPQVIHHRLKMKVVMKKKHRVPVEQIGDMRWTASTVARAGFDTHAHLSIYETAVNWLLRGVLGWPLATLLFVYSRRFHYSVKKIRGIRCGLSFHISALRRFLFLGVRTIDGRIDIVAPILTTTHDCEQINLSPALLLNLHFRFIHCDSIVPFWYG